MLYLSLPLAKMDLPSFLWLWKIAAWSMGFSLMAYAGLLLSGGWILFQRGQHPSWLRNVHLSLGILLLLLVLGLLSIGVVGTLGEHGSLGQSIHGVAGVSVVCLTIASALSARQIIRDRPWARTVHKLINGLLGLTLLWVLWTGWIVVQPYL